MLSSNIHTQQSAQQAKDTTTLNIEDYYHIQGRGPSIVFIHGSFATHATWKRYCEQLSAHYQCISIKLPGHGGAPEPTDTDAPSEALELEIIESIIQQHCQNPIHLVGHSYGGVVALNLAMNNNIAIKQLTLFEPVAVWALNDSSTLAQHQAVAEFLAAYQQAAANNEPFACQRVIDFWGGEGAFASLPQHIQNTMPALTDNNLRHWQICTHSTFSLADLKHVTAATQVICGDKSNPILGDIAAQLCQHIPCSQTHTIAGASHFLVNSHTSDCLRYLNQQ